MNDEPKYPRRKQLRIPKYDYTSIGAYHVIICTENKNKILSFITYPKDEFSFPQVSLTDTGKIVEKTIQYFDNKYSYINIEDYCIMPNHVHLLVVYNIKEDNNNRISLSNFISLLKGNVSRNAGKRLWERSFYEHTIRGKEDYIETKKYIQENPIKWSTDDYNI